MKRKIALAAATLALVTVGAVGTAEADQPVCEDRLLRSSPINDVADNPDIREAVDAITDKPGYDGTDLAEDLPQLATGHGDEVSSCATGTGGSL